MKGEHTHPGKQPHKLSTDEVRWLRRIANGTINDDLPFRLRQRFLDLGLIEDKLGRCFPTPEGRQQIEMRSRETGLNTLTRRWRDRSAELRVIAHNMTSGDSHSLHELARQWDGVANQLEKLERLEMSEPLLGPVVGRPRKPSPD